jgi:hypothetical protein
VEAEQDSSIRIEDLTKVGMAGSCLGLAEKRLVPLKRLGTSLTPMIVQMRFMTFLPSA